MAKVHVFRDCEETARWAGCVSGPRSARFAFRLAACALLAGCVADPSADATTDTEVVDSAGVQLVRNLRTTADTQAVQLTEELRIGMMDGPEEYQFHNITGVATDAQGRVYVIDQGTQAVRIYDRDGRFIRRFGGPGEGPGEFTSIAQLFVWRDTVHVADGRRFSGALFDTTGALLATYTSRLPNGSALRVVGPSPAGWFLFDDSLFARKAREQAGDVSRYFAVIARLDPRLLQRATASRAAADSLLSPVAQYRGGRVFWRLGSEGGSERFPLGNPPFFEPSPASAADQRGSVHIAPGWPYVIDTYDAAGAHVRRITRAHDSIPVTDALVSEVLRRVRAHYDTAGARDVSHAYALRAEFPRIGFVPVTSTMHASDDGWLWVRRPDLEPDPAALVFSQGAPPRASHWDVFDDQGVLRYTVRLPERFVVRAVMANGVIGVQRDELDVQYVVKYGVRAAQ